jgi:hypothetical protein
MRTAKVVIFIMLSLPLALTACSPQPGSAEPTVDVVGATAAQLASLMLTQTSAAYTPTPLPATETPVPLFTETPSPEPTSAATTIPQVSGRAACYTGPGADYPLVSNISDTKQVEVVGISSVPGWYVIRNPIYGPLCWISAGNLRFEADFDLSSLPVIL